MCQRPLASRCSRAWRGLTNGSSAGTIAQAARSVPIQYFVRRSGTRAPGPVGVDLDDRRHRQAGRQHSRRAWSFASRHSPAGDRFTGDVGRGFEPIPRPADEELLAVLEHRRPGPDERAVGAAEVGEHPDPAAVLLLLADQLGVAAGDLGVVRQTQVALGPADDEPLAAEADDFAVVGPVVEDVQQRRRRPAGRLEKSAASRERRRSSTSFSLWRRPVTS